jgi:DNA-binding transcriptional regulator GbsR (MarR family)
MTVGNIANDVVKEYLKAISNETRLNIWFLIVVFRDITLDKISYFLGKSKSTVHHHIQILLDSNLVEEATKPGSKTRYYKPIELNLTVKFREYFNKSVFEEETPEKQKELSDMYEDIVKINSIQIINTIQFLLDNYFENLDDDVKKRYKQMGEIAFASFYLSEENAQKFRKEQRELAWKYLKDDSENPDREKPYSFSYVGYHLGKTLNRKFKHKKKKRS